MKGPILKERHDVNPSSALTLPNPSTAGQLLQSLFLLPLMGKKIGFNVLAVFKNKDDVFYMKLFYLCLARIKEERIILLQAHFCV